MKISLSNFEKDGFVVTAPLLTKKDCVNLQAHLFSVEDKGAGMRNILSERWCKILANSLRESPFLRELLPPDPVAVQCTYFEKSQEQNWLVPLHQDLCIPVLARVDHPDLAGWSTKEGINFVQPPACFLEELTAVRLHLDDCGEMDGALKVVPGTHKLGRLNIETSTQLRNELGEVLCTVDKGAALVMKPLLLHASSKSHGLSKRRVLHFVFGPRALPYNLQWRHAV